MESDADETDKVDFQKYLRPGNRRQSLKPRGTGALSIPASRNSSPIKILTNEFNDDGTEQSLLLKPAIFEENK